MPVRKHENLSPAEKEADIRRAYTSTQHTIRMLMRRLIEEYEYSEYLGDQIAEIDIYGAEDWFGQPSRVEIPTSTTQNQYEF